MIRDITIGQYYAADSVIHTPPFSVIFRTLSVITDPEAYSRVQAFSLPALSRILHFIRPVLNYIINIFIV